MSGRYSHLLIIKYKQMFKRNTIVFSIIAMLVMVFSSGCKGGCANPDCSFEKLQPPLILMTKNFKNVSVKDVNGKIWESSTDWQIAKSILVEGYKVGDTIGGSNYR